MFSPFFKETLEGDKKKPEVETPGAAPTPAAPAAGGKQLGKYVPPSMRDGANKGRGEVMQSKRGKKTETENSVDSSSYIRVWYAFLF